ncbi:hypothetical protein HMN09_00140200 [Mycena chlorophos]|uniref:Uncharacterized protein n=1 Tax=Mycena chlorophos TaxID=658473 RepID=A0A8H6TPS0_MYCCL|nr:hypothetical protein HMN09_00140200 [Mycena chlorophos]
MVSIIVDDRDPAIEYSGAWATTNSQGQSLGTPAEYQSTTKQPSEEESSLSFTFTGQSSFFFDYIIYYTSTRKTGQTVFLDDADVGPYSGTWTPINGNSSDSFFKHTHHATTSGGSSMSMVLDFADGDKLYLYGALGSSSETSNLVLSLLVSIDGASQSSVNPISADPGTLSTNNLIYQSPPQNAGTHSFDFIYTSGPQLGVDYFLLIGGTVISTGSGTGSATGMGLTTTLDGTPTMGGEFIHCACTSRED